MNKKELSERDICTKFITPALTASGWDVDSQVREQLYFTKGRIIVRGKLVSRGKASFADYVLYYKPNIPIAIIEAKDNNQPVGGGMQQGLRYAEILDIPFVFSSNGDGFIFHDRTGQAEQIETELSLDLFPRPEVLWSKFRAWKQIDSTEEQVVLRHPFLQATQFFQVERVGRIGNCAGPEKQQALENRMVQAVEQGRGERERCPDRGMVGRKHQRRPQAEINNANVFDAVIGEQALQIMLPDRVQDTQQAGYGPCEQHQISPPTGAAAEKVKSEADQTVNRSFQHYARHQGRHRTGRDWMRSRQP